MKKVLFFAAAVYVFSISMLSAHPVSGNGRVVYINSYNTEYIWGRTVAETITDILKKNRIVTETYFLDSLNKSDKQLKLKASEIINSIKSEKPDVIIISDDAAAKYIITDDILKSGIPIVFCGINWDASVYGLTNENSTGMIEINPTDELLNYMNRIIGKTDGTARIGIISVDNISQRKNYEYDLKKYNIRYNQTYFIKTMDEWENAYRELQKDNDYIFMPNLGGIKNWDDDRAFAVINENKKIPTVSAIDSSARFVLLTFAKYPEEQGEFAANAAVRIINGEKVQNIPHAVNKYARVLLNSRKAENLGISVPRDILELSEIIP